MAGASNKKTLIIVLAIVAVLVLCCCGAVLGLVAVGIIAEPETLIEELAGDPTIQPDGSPGIDSRDFGVEVQRAIDRFYPGYTLDFFAILEGSDDAEARFHVVALYPEADEFRILFLADRSNADRTGYTPGDTEYLDPVSGALWTHDTGASGLQAWAGPGSIAPKVEIPGPFVAAHPGGNLLVTDYGMISNVQVRLSGIREAEIDDWDGASTSWESVWDLDIANSRWDEISFVE